MNDISTRAQATVARIMAETPSTPDAFVAYEINPYEFAWQRDGFGPDADTLYVKRELGKVQGRARKAPTSAGGSATSRSGRIPLSELRVQCAACHQVHPVLSGCIR